MGFSTHPLYLNFDVIFFPEFITCQIAYFLVSYVFIINFYVICLLFSLLFLSLALHCVINYYFSLVRVVSLIMQIGFSKALRVHIKIALQILVM